MNTLRQRSRGLEDETNRLNAALARGNLSAHSYATRMQEIQRELERTRQRQANLSAAMRNHGVATQNSREARANLMAAGATTAAIAAPFATMTMTAVNFEAIMSKVKAITGATGIDFESLTAKARELGATTQFSATQAGEAMTYLGMAGWKTDQIIAGMPGLLNLAAAGGTDLARTADIISDDLTAFGLEADQAGHMADVFAKTITSTNTNVEMLGESMKYAAPVAHAFGASMEETSALAGLMANSGIKASQAGTALRAGFLRLAGPPKMASKAMEKLGMSMNDITAEQKEATMAMASLGIEMSDASGPKKMSTILRELKDRTADLGKEEKLAALKAIFGTEAATGWLAVLDAGPEKFDAMVEALENSDGAAEKMAKTMTNNAMGAIIQMKSAIESASISIGNVFLPMLASGAKNVAAMASGIADWAGRNPELTQTIMMTGSSILGGVLAIKAGIAAYRSLVAIKTGYQLLMQREIGIRAGETASKMATVVWTKAAALAQWAWNAAMTANPIGLVIAAIAALIGMGYLLYKNWDTITAFLGSAWEGMVSFFHSGWESFKAGLSEAWNVFTGFCSNLPSMIAYGIGYAIGYLSTMPARIGAFVSAAGVWLSELPARCTAAGEAFIVAAGSWLVSTYNTVTTWLSTTVTDAGTWMYNLPQTCEEAGVVFIAAAESWASGAYDAIATWITQIPDMVSEQINAAGTGISNWWTGVWSSAKSGFSAGAADGEVAHNAQGGIYGQGAFLTTFAEKSPEAAIPLDGSPRAIGLWRQAGQMLGMNPVSAGRSVSATFAPQIHIAGNADMGTAQQIQQVLQESLADFERKLTALQSQKARTSYA